MAKDREENLMSTEDADERDDQHGGEDNGGDGGGLDEGVGLGGLVEICWACCGHWVLLPHCDTAIGAEW